MQYLLYFYSLLSSPITYIHIPCTQYVFSKDSWINLTIFTHSRRQYNAVERALIPDHLLVNCNVLNKVSLSLDFLTSKVEMIMIILT